MRVCDVVKDSIWYDPRVKKQIESYISNGVELTCVGVKDPRYNKDEIDKIPCKVLFAEVDEKFYSNKLSIFKKIARELRTNREIYGAIVSSKPDIIHANDLNALIPAYKAAKKLKCKIVYDSHEIFLENPWIARNKIVKFIWSVFEKKLIHKVDLMICVSNAAADYFVSKYHIERPLVVTNCISSNRIIYEQTERAFPKQILNHGQFYEGRGYDIMIEASPLLKKYPDLQLVLRGYGELEEKLKNRVAEIGASNVDFLPPVRVEELIPCAAHAWVALAITQAISINFKLSVSNKIFEYAAAGLPVIMSDIPEHRFLNDKYHFGIVIEHDTPEDIVNAVERLYFDAKFYKQCSENAIKLSKEINWEQEFSKLLAREEML